MNILSQLPKTVDKRKKRLGRGLGSGKGAKSGRGTTRHQAARTDIPLHFEGGQNRMVKRFPLLRGKGRNKPVSVKPNIVSLSQLEKYEKGEVVSLDTLIAKKIVQAKKASLGAKIVANGTITKALSVELAVSQKAKEAIEKAGGTVSS